MVLDAPQLDEGDDLDSRPREEGGRVATSCSSPRVARRTTDLH
jgi:hypothetical protein